MTAALVGMLAAGAVLLLQPVVGAGAPRLPAQPGAEQPADAPPLLRAPARLSTALLVAVAVAAVAGGVLGLVAGAAAGGAVAVGLAQLSVRAARPRPLEARDAALLAELLAACVEAGVPLVAATRHASAAVPTATGAALAAASRLLEVGADARTALAVLLADPATVRLARGLQRALESGAAPALVLRTAAAGQHDRQRSARIARARGIGSRAALPVGLCFLPAFVLVAVVPVVVGGLGRALP